MSYQRCYIQTHTHTKKSFLHFFFTSVHFKMAFIKNASILLREKLCHWLGTIQNSLKFRVNLLTAYSQLTRAFLIILGYLSFQTYNSWTGPKSSTTMLFLSSTPRDMKPNRKSAQLPPCVSPAQTHCLCRPAWWWLWVCLSDSGSYGCWKFGRWYHREEYLALSFGALSHRFLPGCHVT